MKKIAVIGAGHFGSKLSTALSEKGVEVLVIDNNLSVIQDISDEVAFAVCTDATNKRALHAENILDYDVAIIAIGNDFVARLLCAANLLDIGVKRIICRTMGENQKIILEKMGITEFLAPEDEVGQIVAERLMNPSLISYLQLPEEYKVAEILAPDSLVGKKVGEVGFRDNYKMSLITIRWKVEEEDLKSKKIPKERIAGVPDNNLLIDKNDVLVVFAKENDIEHFIKDNS
ncbi:MAG: TrkA family potassium uptake protein [Bacteroidales bacterium]|jgi:trk system potassium uptake protein TrkA|nr:TrkA family potassium uptake protein [Bacteroidales bacterium]